MKHARSIHTHLLPPASLVQNMASASSSVASSVARGVCVIVGAGGNVGASIARVFATAGFDLALVSRSSGTLERIASEVAPLHAPGCRTLCVPADASQVRHCQCPVAAVLSRLTASGDVETILH